MSAERTPLQITDKGRAILVQVGEPNSGNPPYLVMPTAETGNPAAKKKSRTFNWEDCGVRYRIQIQTTEVG